MGRHRRQALAALAAVGAVLMAAAPATAAPAASPAGAAPGAVVLGGRGLPPPPACPTAVAMASGRHATRAAPLPPPSSDAGGARLAQPGLQISVPARVPRPPALRAAAWIISDLSTGNVLASCNGHVPLAPASTLKILTAVALHPRIDSALRYVARPQDAAIDGTKVGLVPGSVYSVDNLWHGLLMGSGNDAANALAALAGGMRAATGLMTTTARKLGAMDTVVANTSGLDAKGQVTSVYDLAIIGRALLHDPALAAVVHTKTYSFPAGGTALTRGSRRTYQIQNHNLLLFHYAGATGVKNGYTTAASASFVGSATRGGHSYLVALLRTDYDSWRLGAALLDWAFSHGGQASPVGVLAPGGTAAAASATGHDAAPPAPSTAPGAGATAAGRIPSAITGPVAATLQSVPSGSRTIYLVAAFAVAVGGGALVRGLATRWPGDGGRRPARGRTKARRRSR